MADINLQMVCEGCGAVVTFPAKDHSTVQECPNCGGYLDIPEITRVPTMYDTQTERYDRQSEETDRQQAICREQLSRRDALDAREAELLDQAANLLARFKELADRAERVLARFD